MVPMLLHLVKAWVFASLAYPMVQLFVQVLIDITKGIHTFVLFVEVFFKLLVVLLKTLMLTFHLIDPC